MYLSTDKTKIQFLSLVNNHVKITNLIFHEKIPVCESSCRLKKKRNEKKLI